MIQYLCRALVNVIQPLKGTYTEVDEVQRELVDLVPEMLCSDCIDREAGKATCEITVHELCYVSPKIKAHL